MNLTKTVSDVKNKTQEKFKEYIEKSNKKM